MRVAGLLFQYETRAAKIIRLPPPSTSVTCAEWQQPKRIEGIKKAEIVEGARLREQKKRLKPTEEEGGVDGSLNCGGEEKN